LAVTDGDAGTEAPPVPFEPIGTGVDAERGVATPVLPPATGAVFTALPTGSVGLPEIGATSEGATGLFPSVFIDGAIAPRSTRVPHATPVRASAPTTTKAERSMSSPRSSSERPIIEQWSFLDKGHLPEPVRRHLQRD